MNMFRVLYRTFAYLFCFCFTQGPNGFHHTRVPITHQGDRVQVWWNAEKNFFLTFNDVNDKCVGEANYANLRTLALLSGH